MWVVMEEFWGCLGRILEDLKHEQSQKGTARGLEPHGTLPPESFRPRGIPPWVPGRSPPRVANRRRVSDPEVPALGSGI